ncbi:MAG: hypothetical protein RBT75_12645, partial [Anaerolineae bacterium]|nr:hypothetical protein [Anaerolineae bacterium]
RKVMIHLARCIEEAWRRTVETAATAEGQVDELGRITAQIPLAAEMGDAALAMLERVLAGDFEGFEPWERDIQGRYQCALAGVTLTYDPATQQLHVEAALSETVSAEARGAAEASGFTVGEVAAEAVGRYYEDGWGGRTLERAEQEAQAAAETQLAAAIEALHREQNQDTLAAAEAQAQAEAQARAREALAARQADVRTALRQQLQQTLARAEERVYHVMNRAVGEAYRQTLRQLVLENGGRIIQDERTGSIIDMELELY